MGDKTRIDWCDATWNPVTGCKHGCDYCYARGIARRYGCKINGDMGNALAVLEEPYRRAIDGRINPYPYEFLPTYHKYRLDIPKRWTKPRNIFVCSMADLFGEWVPDVWINDVFDACLAAPQHRYLFLTKNPKRYIDLMKKRIIPHWINTRNMWFGSTATFKKSEVYGDAPERNTFMSIEPIMEPFHDLGDRACIVDWIIVGAETGNRKGKVNPKKDWIMEMSENCTRTHTPIFMKESLREIMGADFRQEFPWGEM